MFDAPAVESRLTSLSQIALRTIDGKSETFGACAGKATLVVNVASRCGFKPQYTGLEKLYRRFSGAGLVVMGFPCDQFGHQEPGDEAEIQKFCSLTYDVTFPMFAKVDVNGERAHPLFTALKAAAPGVMGTAAIKWNFTKFLIDGQGRVVARYGPAERPEGLGRDIEPLLR